MAIYVGIVNDGTFVSLDGYRLQDANNEYLTATQASDKWKIVLDNVVYRLNIDINAKEGA